MVLRRHDRPAGARAIVLYLIRVVKVATLVVRFANALAHDHVQDRTRAIFIASLPGARHSALDMLLTRGTTRCEGQCRARGGGGHCAWCLQRLLQKMMREHKKEWWKEAAKAAGGPISFVFSLADKGLVGGMSPVAIVRMNCVPSLRTGNGQQILVVTPGRCGVALALPELRD